MARFWSTAFLGFVISLSGGCGFDETPADIHRKLVPQIAQELIVSKQSRRLVGLPSEATMILRRHAKDKIVFEIGAQELNAETGIRFYSKDEHRFLLAVGLDLNATGDGYIVSGITKGPEK